MKAKELKGEEVEVIREVLEGEEVGAVELLKEEEERKAKVERGGKGRGE